MQSISLLNVGGLNGYIIDAKKEIAPHARGTFAKGGKELDEYMCFFCNNTHKSNHGHHIIFYSEKGEASIDNMITLCPKCHRDYHAGRLKIDIGRF